MSEKLQSKSPESSLAQNAEASRQHLDKLHAKLEKAATEAKMGNDSEHLEKATTRVEKHAQPIERHQSRAAESHNDNRNGHGVSIDPKKERQANYNRTIARVRKKENFIERPFSKVIHNPVVDKVSEATGKTVARPSSMLGGAFFAMIGTSALLWIAKHYGYEYSYFAVIGLFLLGMIVGVALEIILKSGKVFGHKS